MALTKIDDRGLNTPIDLLDNEKIRLGTGNDLELYHDASNSYIKDTGTGDLNIAGSIVRLQSSGGETLARGVEDGAFELYHNNSKRLETTGGGVKVHGGSGQADLSVIGAEGQDAFLKLITDDGDDSPDYYQILHQNSDNSLRIQNYGDGAYEDNIVTKHGGNVELYFDNSKKFETTSDGGQVTGALKVKVAGSGYGDGLILEDNDSTNKSELTHVDGVLYISADASTNHLTINSDGHVDIVNDNDQLRLGAGQDLLLYSDGTQGIIRSANGRGYIQSDTGISISSIGYTEKYIDATKDGSVELYYDNSKKFETTSDGVEVKHASGTAILKVTGYEGNAGAIWLAADDGDDYTDTCRFHQSTDGRLYIQNVTASNTWENMITAGANSGVELYFDNSIKVETRAGDTLFHDDIRIQDNNKINIGTGDDLQLYHDGTSSIIENATGNLAIRGKTGENHIVMIPDSKTALYYNNEKVFETYEHGVLVENTDGNGEITIRGSEGNGSFVYFEADDGDDNADRWRIDVSASANHFIIADYADGSWEQNIKCNHGGNVEIYYDNSKKLETTSSGVTVTGSVTETSDIALKTNITPIDNVLDKIQQITGYTYQFKDTGHDSMGVTAQDVEKVFPELVHGEEGSKTLQYSGLIGALIESVKELSKKVAALETA